MTSHMSTEHQPPERRLLQNAESLASSVSDRNRLTEVRESLGALKKTSPDIQNFFRSLDQLFYREPVEWMEIKDTIWETDELRNSNHFPFLQGDLIQTKLVQSLGKYELPSDKWIVVENTCGATRRPFVKVAPAVPVFLEYKTLGGTDNGKLWNNLMWAIKMKGYRFYPYPNPHFESPNSDPFAFLCILEAPYYIERSDVRAAVSIRSMSFPGWLVFKTFLQESELSANVEEEKQFRKLRS